MFTSYIKIIQNFAWERDLESLSKYQHKLVQAIRISYCVLRDLFDGMLTLQAMSLVYTTLLSLVPLIAVSFSVLKGFGVHNQVEPMLISLLAPLGDKGAEITAKIIEFVENTKAGVLGLLGLVLLFYTVVSLIQKIERSFNFTWRISKPRPFAQRFSDYLSVVLLGPLLIFSAIGATASIMGSTAIQEVMSYEGIGWIVSFVARLVPYLLVIAAFTLIYIFVPNTRVTFKAALIGACVSGVLWETVGWVFATVVVNSAKYTAIYSAFATLIFFMIWLYLCWMILLIGASIAFYVQNPELRTLATQNKKSSIRISEKIALLVMAAVSRAFYSDEHPVDEKAIAENLRVTPTLLLPVIDQLLAGNMLLRTDGDNPGLVPAHPPDAISALDVIRDIRKSGEEGESFNMLPQNDQIDDCLSAIDSAFEKELAAITLKDLSKDS